jgi:glycosyltransferase involved in cell wall biosynthesis
MEKPKLLYDVRVIRRGKKDKTNRTGIYFVCRNVLEHLKKNKDFKVIEYYDNQFINRLIRYLNNIVSSKRVIRKFAVLLRIFEKLLFVIFSDKKLASSDIFFSPVLPFPDMLRRSPEIKKFMVLHDVMPLKFPSYYPPGNSIGWKIGMSGSFDESVYCFCVSECTKNDFLEYFGERLDKNKMTVTYNSTARDFKPLYDTEKLKKILLKYNIKMDRSQKYIFSFCSIEPRKNLVFTVKCFVSFIQKHDIQDLFFFLGGVHWDGFIKTFEESVGSLPESCRSKVKRLGYVDDKDVNILYSNSLFFTYISEYEGFGMPPLEAMQAGTPVITSDNSSLPEVVGDAAIKIAYNDEEACIKAMEDLYFNESLRKEYITKGFERAKLFSWEKTVKTMADKMLEAMKNEDDKKTD